MRALLADDERWRYMQSAEFHAAVDVLAEVALSMVATFANLDALRDVERSARVEAAMTAPGTMTIPLTEQQARELGLIE